MLNNIQYIEAMLQDAFCQIPFHNLFYLCKNKSTDFKNGGTCSDKVLAFKEKLSANGITSTVHSVLINEQKTHRVLVITIENRRYFADVGNGWPSVKLFPATQTILYSAYGIIFKSELKNGYLNIYHIKANNQSLSLSIPLASQNEDEVYQDIKNRFSGDFTYPFANGLRYAQVVGDEFIFLKGNNLRFFKANKPVRCLKLASHLDALKSIQHYFSVDFAAMGIDSSQLLNVLQKNV